jgi:UDP-N-acetylmuramyl pentapeptide phosphotransferase/UDP-N-acetylglucosamine-1-phosphate transferase
MPDVVLYCLAFVLLVVLVNLYFKIAERYQIIDKPNQRSSHVTPTIRGGGIIFLFAILLWFVLDGFHYPWFVFGTLLIAGVSFIDDLGEQSARVRLLVQFTAFMAMGWEAGLVAQPVWVSAIMLVVGVGTLNAFNFMDGINGITGVYALVNLVSLFLINEYITVFTNTNLIVVTAIAMVIFLFYNFRKRARCFAGDVGSVTIAFVQVFLVILLIAATGNYSWYLMFLIYGLDTVVTILYRLKNRENIFKAHRSHLFQYLSNELKISHLGVSVLYGTLQLIVNAGLVFFLKDTSLLYIAAFVLASGIVYVIVREQILKKIGIKGFFG